VTCNLPHTEKWSKWYQFMEANPELSPCDIGKHIGPKQAAVSRRLTAHPRPVKDVLDLALHRFFAPVGQEVGRA
jgi:hypothetical protein